MNLYEVSFLIDGIEYSEEVKASDHKEAVAYVKITEEVEIKITRVCIKEVIYER